MISFSERIWEWRVNLHENTKFFRCSSSYLFLKCNFMYLLEEEMYWCPTGAMIIKVEKDEMLTLIAFYIFTLSSSIARTLCNSLNCEHGCKSSLEGGVCTCPKGKKVADDNKSCVGKSSHKNTSPSEIFLVLYYGI